MNGPPLPRPKHRTLNEALAASAASGSGLTFVDLAEREAFVPYREVHERARRTAGALRSRGVGPAALGLIQFSSGSTADPRPVALTHESLLAQLAALRELLPAEDAVPLKGVCWLPLYHDMGLIGCLLQAFYYPAPLVLIPPELFLARPGLWLRAVARHRATISVAPSFAYALCARRVRDLHGGADPSRHPREDGHPPPHRPSSCPGDDSSHVERQAPPERGAAPVSRRGALPAVARLPPAPVPRGPPLVPRVREGPARTRRPDGRIREVRSRRGADRSSDTAAETRSPAPSR